MKDGEDGVPLTTVLICRPTFYFSKANQLVISLFTRPSTAQGYILPVSSPTVHCTNQPAANTDTAVLGRSEGEK